MATPWFFFTGETKTLKSFVQFILMELLSDVILKLKNKTDLTDSQLKTSSFDPRTARYCFTLQITIPLADPDPECSW